MPEHGVVDVDVSWDRSTWWFTETFGNTAYDDITADVKSISIRRGRSSDMGQMQQGTCTIRLKDEAGKYNPENAGSALNGYLIPMRPIRVRAVYSATTYPLFYGYIKRIEHDPSPNVKESTIEAVDLSFAMTYLTPNISGMPGDPGYVDQTVGALIHELVDAMAIDAAVWCAADSGHVVPLFAPDGTQTILSLIGDLVEVDQGMLFVAADGIVTYYDIDRLYTRQTAVATFDETMVTGLRATITDDGMINTQSVTKTGGTTQTAVLPAGPGEAFSLVRTGGDITSTYLASDSQAASLAQFIVYTKGNPTSPARSLTLVNGDATRLTQQLARELGDFVTVDETAGGTAFSGWIASIEHEISSGGLVHKTTFAVQKRTVSFFTIGTSTIGGSDIIGY